jgi:hypothetical protein
MVEQRPIVLDCMVVVSIRAKTIVIDSWNCARIMFCLDACHTRDPNGWYLGSRHYMDIGRIRSTYL